VAEKKQLSVDLYGEPLPPGAIARMGTIQFRQPPANSPASKFLADPTIGVAFSPEGQVIATSWWDRLRLWNANTGTPAGSPRLISSGKSPAVPEKPG
jgi:WD40 repeat protein